MQRIPSELDSVDLYLRKSREDREAEERARREGREESETLARHRRQLLELAHRHKHNIRHIFEEVVSGEYISERPEVQRLLKDVEDGNVQGVWVMDIDRLGRGDMADQGAILRAFKDSSTLILTPDKVYDLNDESDEELTEFKTFLARRELKSITKRMQRGRIASVREGKFIGTKPPFGYDVSSDLILFPNQDADTVKTIFDLYTTRGMGCNRIAHYLNSLGIKSPRGKIWRGESVLALLGNPVYAGWITWKRSYQDKRRGIAHRRPEEEWIKAKGKHEPLIDEVAFERVKKIRSSRTHSSVRSDRTPSSPLSGLIECSKCGEKMIKRPYAKQAAHLICKNPNCKTRSTRLSLVEERLIKYIFEWLKNYKLSISEVSASLGDVPRPLAGLEKKVGEIGKDIDRINFQRDNLHNLLEQGIYNTETYLERNQKLLTELAVCREQRSQLEKEIAKEAELQQAHGNIIPMVTNILDAYSRTENIAKKNTLLKELLQKAVYHKEPWQIGEDFELELHLNVQRV